MSADDPYETDPLQYNPSTGSGGWGRPNHMGWQQKHSSKHSDKNGLDCSRFVTWFTRVMGTDKDHLVFLHPCVVSDPVHGISRVFILNRDWTHPNEIRALLELICCQLYINHGNAAKEQSSPVRMSNSAVLPAAPAHVFATIHSLCQHPVTYPAHQMSTHSVLIPFDQIGGNCRSTPSDAWLVF